MTDNANPLDPARYPDLPPLGALAEKLGMVLTAISPQYAAATMPVRGNTQPVGLLHGGASAALGETVGSFAAAVYGAERGLHAVGVEVAMTHHRSIREGNVTGIARARHLGATLATYELSVVDEDERLLASGHLTCMLIAPRPSEAVAPPRS